MKILKTLFDKASATVQTLILYIVFTVVVFFVTLVNIPKLLQQSKTSTTKTKKTKANSSNDKSTVDEENVEIFAKLDFWNDNGKMRVLRNYNLARVPYIVSGILRNTGKDSLKNIKILDVGCGGGFLSEDLAKTGAQVTGIDASEDLITVAVEHRNINPDLQNNNPTYHHVTIEEHIKSHANYYDAVVASEVIEHVNNPDLFLQSCVKAVKPGGLIILTTPNRTLLSFLVVIFFYENIVDLIPKGAHEHDKLINPTELSGMLEKNNCHVFSSVGVFLNAFNFNWSIIKSQVLMYAVQAVKAE